jgi:hypothetical protein
MSNYGCVRYGSYRLFKWDTAAGCMAPFELSTPARKIVD